MLQKGRVYIGKVNKDPVVYEGFTSIHDIDEAFHQFTYVIPRSEKVGGYGQNPDQMLAENYMSTKLMRLLYE